MESWDLNNSEKYHIENLYYIYRVLKQFIKYAPGVHRRFWGTYEHGERSRSTEPLTGTMFSGVLAVFFFSFLVL